MSGLMALRVILRRLNKPVATEGRTDIAGSANSFASVESDP